MLMVEEIVDTYTGFVPSGSSKSKSAEATFGCGS